ncbi:MAG: PepSY domain-containing protein [Chitinophagaceae bacterium]
MGVVLGVQFLLWTMGGLYFSWSNIDEIHGDLQRRHIPRLTGNVHLISPESVLAIASDKIDSINSIQLVNIFQKPYYDITFFSKGQLLNVLADAQTGSIRKPINREEAIRIAAANFNGKPALKSVEYLTSTGRHHEYREKPLPAWAITFHHPTNTTVYISADFGKVESFRNNKWRIFDFLWMMHTMDYKERDNFNNWLLRAFAIFGLLTIFSGFALYYVSFRRRRSMRPYGERL